MVFESTFSKSVLKTTSGVFVSAVKLANERCAHLALKKDDTFHFKPFEVARAFDCLTVVLKEKDPAAVPQFMTDSRDLFKLFGELDHQRCADLDNNDLALLPSAARS